jgi:hypothetical protein
MRNLTQASAVLAALLSASGALAVAAVGCGGDDTSVATDAQADATADQTTDGTSSADQATDVKHDHALIDGAADVLAHPDASKNDASDGGASDADASDVRASDADASDVATIISAALLAFPNKVNAAYCERVAQCCGFDGGAGFNIAQCIADNVSVGGFYNVDVAQVDSGNILLDETAATACLNDIASFDCETLSDPQWTNALSACTTALQGQIGVNDGKCTSYWDCTAGGYCVKPDGGSSHCVTLSPEGGPCSDFGSSTDCTFKGAGAPAEYCAPVGDGSTGVCEPNLPLSANCNYDQWCATQICDPGTASTLNGECQTSTLFTDPGIAGGYCAFYTLDGG